MDKIIIRHERERLQGVLDRFLAGTVTPRDEAEFGMLRENTAAASIENLRKRITDCDRKLSEAGWTHEGGETP